MLLIGPIGGCGHFARDLLLSRVVSRTLLRNTERGARGRCLKRLRIAVLVFHPFPCSWYASTLLPPEIVYPFSCVPTRYGRVVNDIMESRSTSPHPPAPLLLLRHVGPPRPTVVNVTSPTTLLFFSRSLTPPFLRIGIRLLLAPAFVLHGIFIAFGKTGRDFASFLLFLSNLPSLCPISICLSFCFQRERDRNNLITARCYVTRKNICIVYSYIVYCDDFFYK